VGESEIRKEIGLNKVNFPVPVSATVCGLAPPSSRTSSVAALEPLLLGVNVTLIVQLPPGATLAPQLLVWANAGGHTSVRPAEPG
jgi:hypothetical protein